MSVVSGCIHEMPGNDNEPERNNPPYVCEANSPLPEKFGDGSDLFGECTKENIDERLENSNAPFVNRIVVDCKCDANECCLWNLVAKGCCFDDACQYVSPDTVCPDIVCE